MLLKKKESNIPADIISHPEFSYICNNLSSRIEILTYCNVMDYSLHFTLYWYVFLGIILLFFLIQI